MAINGKIYVVPNPEERTWTVLVANEGNSPFSITQNVLPPGNPDLKAHDDNGLNGHGLGVDVGKVSRQKFHEGDRYNHGGGVAAHTVNQDCFLRLGIRDMAYKAIPMPDLNGPPVELDIADFTWYSGNAQTAQGQNTSYPGTREHVTNAPDGPAMLLRVRELMLRSQTNGITCEGQASVTAVTDDKGRMSHWEVRFDNTGDQAYIATCTFKRGEKNEGLGLESMGLPNKDSAAMQRIEYLGNYGVDAVPGEVLRLGVRGYSWIEVKLPTEGTVEIPLDKFRIDTAKMSEAYFDHDKVLEKRNDKRDRVQFFEGGKSINDALEPKVYRGEEAKVLADFAAPDLIVRAVEASDATPGGGWIVAMRSNLPEFDDKGRIGFVAAILAHGADPRSEEARKLGTKKLQHTGHEKEWFIPRGADIGGVIADEGTAIEVATRGLGWSANVALPGKDEVIDSRKDDQLWGLREDQVARRALETRFINRFRE